MRTDWFRLAPTVSGQSAVAVERAYDPVTGLPHGSLDELGAAPGDLVRRFVLAQDSFLVGEPIVAELEVALEGPGTWKEPIGGNYRARGRDDNFLFVMVPERGAVPDPYGPERIMMGGISTTYEVTRGEPQSYFHAVQRYSAVHAPGRYDLYCIRFAGSHEAIGWREALATALERKVGGAYRLAPEGNDLLLPNGEPSGKSVSPAWVREPSPTPSPIAASLPPAVRAVLPEPEQQRVQDFAHFEVELRVGSASERAAMVKRWSSVAESTQRQMRAGRAEATRQAIWFDRGPDFLPVLERWLDAKADVPPQDLAGLAMRPSSVALDLLLRKGGEYGLAAASHIPRNLVSTAVPRVIAKLDDPNDGVRSYAFNALTSWTGERFGASWSGFRQGQPTVEEGRALQATADSWWKTHRDGFVPATGR